MSNISYETRCLTIELDPTPMEEEEGCNPHVEIDVESAFWQEGETYGDTVAYRQESEIREITGVAYDFERQFRIIDEENMSYGQLVAFLQDRGVDVDKEIDKVL